MHATDTRFRGARFAPLLGLLLMGCAHTSSAANTIYSAQIGPDLRLTQIAQNVWMHTATKAIEGDPAFASNGLLVVNGEQALLIDTAWTNEQTATLLDWVKSSMHVVVTDVIVTHHHDDRIGGLAAAHSRGVRSYATRETIALAREEGVELPQNEIGSDAAFSLANVSGEIFFPGAGHTRDNIVIWLPQAQVLFGGCFLRAMASGIGNIADADVSAWSASVARVTARYVRARVVVPGHGAIGDARILTHTADLASEHARSHSTSPATATEPAL